MRASSSGITERVVIAGGGVAAVETLLALRYATDGGARQTTVVAPGEELVYRPLAVTEPFGPPEPRRYRLDEICEDLGARLVTDTVAAVDGDRRVATTGSGRELPYDALVVAPGARAVPALDGVFTFFGGEEPDGLRWIVRELVSGEARTVAFVVPAGNGWSLPIYELALMTARRAADAGAASAALTLVTPEDRPLAIFQGAGSDAVAQLLGEAGIAVETDAYAHGYDGRALLLEPGQRRLAADRVVALPRLEGPAIAGLPSDPDGFVRVDERNRVQHMDRVWAIGDATTFPVKHGGIATQQADVVAAAISGGGGGLPPLRPQVRAILYTGERPLYLTATITAGESVVSSVSHRCPWWPPHKIAARHLAPYLADRVPLNAVAARASSRHEEA